MLKITELRIGNLVYGISERIETITGLTDSGQILTYKLNYTAINDISDISGIPISFDILEKCGFTYRSDHRGEGAIMDFRECEKMVGILVFKEYEINGGGWGTGGTSAGAKVPYLHTLQNLYFALTGNELTLK